MKLCRRIARRGALVLVSMRGDVVYVLAPRDIAPGANVSSSTNRAGASRVAPFTTGTNNFAGDMTNVGMDAMVRAEGADAPHGGRVGFTDHASVFGTRP